MPENKLSIIMPCYNCSPTLEEAVDSIYTQNLKTNFEVVMVDDGSNDNTREIIKKLAKKYSAIKYYFHDKNKGGGAARNTAVANSSGTIIFCLDSDDILPDNTLQKMIDYLDEKKCDGVLFHESRYFVKDKNNADLSSFNIPGKKAYALGDLFADKGWLTVVNFLYTKNAFKVAGGYPEHHGFDSQGFGFRFLSKGLKTFTCPNTFYYHRQAEKGKKSYFNRVYENGLLSINHYFIFEEILYLFNDSIIKEIINYKVFDNNKLGSKNLNALIKKTYRKVGEKIFVNNYKKHLDQNSFKKFIDDNADKKNLTYLFTLAIYEYKNKKYEKSLKILSELEKKYPSSAIIKFNILRSKIGVGRNFPHNRIEGIALDSKDAPKIKKQTVHLFILKKILLKIPGLITLYRKIKK